VGLKIGFLPFSVPKLTRTDNDIRQYSKGMDHRESAFVRINFDKKLAYFLGSRIQGLLTGAGKDKGSLRSRV
jgi:hypothetical protein